MLDVFFAMMAATMNGAAGSDTGQAQALSATGSVVAQTTEESSVQIDQNSVVIGENTSVQGSVAGSATGAVTGVSTAATQQFNMAVVPAGLQAEPQIPSGKFTTAAEVRPIMDATKGNWVAVREYDGKDWLYVTHIWSWRCGLKAMAISVNGETMQNWPLPPCHEQFVTPNAVLEDDGVPVLTFRLKSVQTITIQVVYDDLSMDVAQFERGNVLIP